MNKIELFLDLSNACNYDCIFCRSRLTNHTIVDIKQIKNFESLLSKISMVDITGYGEVTIHPQFDEYLDYFTKFNIPIRFVTNGSTLIKKTDKIILAPIKQLVISLNSLDPDLYKKITGGKGNLPIVLLGIDKLMKAVPPSFDIVLSFVITSWNIHELFDYINYAKKYNIPLSLLDLTPTIKDYSEGLLLEDNKENRDKLEEAKKYAKSIGADLRTFSFDNRKVTESGNNVSEVVKRCNWVNTKSFIGTDGRVGVCCWSTFSPGNIFEQDFDSIWNGEKYNELRNCIKKGDLKYCSNCRREG